MMENKFNYFNIIAYWKDTGEHFQAVVTDAEETLEEDDIIFFYGLTEKLIKEAIADNSKTAHEFAIVEYELIRD